MDRVRAMQVAARRAERAKSGMRGSRLRERLGVLARTRLQEFLNRGRSKEGGSFARRR